MDSLSYEVMTLTARPISSDAIDHFESTQIHRHSRWIHSTVSNWIQIHRIQWDWDGKGPSLESFFKSRYKIGLVGPGVYLKLVINKATAQCFPRLNIAQAQQSWTPLDKKKYPSQQRALFLLLGFFYQFFVPAGLLSVDCSKLFLTYTSLKDLAFNLVSILIMVLWSTRALVIWFGIKVQVFSPDTHDKPELRVYWRSAQARSPKNFRLLFFFRARS